MRSNPPCPRRAFTLIEVLVSLAIFALASVVLSVAYLNVIGSYRALDSQQRSDEDWKVLRAGVLTEPDLAKVEEGGRVVLPGGRELAWRAKVEPTEIADLFRLTLEGDVPAAGEAEAWQRTQHLYVLRPSWSDPAEREKLRDVTRQRLFQERVK
jgi:general secretion pathway protein I